MKRAAAVVAGLLLAAPAGVKADATLLATSAAATLGTQVTADLVHTPYAGLGVYASRWDSQDYGTLTGYGIRLGWNLYGPIGLEGRAAYLESKDDAAQTTLIPLEAALTWRFRLNKYWAPYVGGGAGYYLRDAEYNDSNSWESSGNSVGYFGLAGLNLYLGPLSLFAEAKYNWIGTEAETQTSLEGPAYAAGLKLGF